MIEDEDIMAVIEKQRALNTQRGRFLSIRQHTLVTGWKAWVALYGRFSLLPQQLRRVIQEQGNVVWTVLYPFTVTRVSNFTVIYCSGHLSYCKDHSPHQPSRYCNGNQLVPSFMNRKKFIPQVATAYSVAVPVEVHRYPPAGVCAVRQENKYENVHLELWAGGGSQYPLNSIDLASFWLLSPRPLDSPQHFAFIQPDQKSNGTSYGKMGVGTGNLSHIEREMSPSSSHHTSTTNHG